MTEPSPPHQPFGYDLTYQSRDPFTGGRTHVMLAGIFNTIMGGLDILYALWMCGMAVFMYLLLTGKLSAKSPAHPGDPPPWIMVSVYFGMGFFGLVVGILKLIAGIKLLRRGANARVWGYIAGAVGCTQIWCSLFCVIPLACGIYTIVAMSLDAVRYYLSQPAADVAVPREGTRPI